MARSPLFDIYDPYGMLAEQAQYGMLPEDDLEPLGVAPIRRKPQLSDLMPEEEQRSMLNRLAAAGSSGLSGLGWILDTPGAVVRGGLSGGPLKALSALWETSDDRVDGRELLRQYGLAGQQDNWLNFAGGVGAEVLLDPMTYMSLGMNQFLGKGAKTAAGLAAERAGLLDDFGVYARNTLGKGEREALRQSTPRSMLESIADSTARDKAMRDFMGLAGSNAEAMLDQPLAKMNRLSLPGMGGDAFDLYGKNVGDWAAKTGDVLGEGLMTNPYTGSTARALGAAFNNDYLGFVDRDKQLDAQTIMAARRAREKADRRTLAALEFDASKALREAGTSLNDSDLSQALRVMVESGEAPTDLQQYIELPAVQKLLGYTDSLKSKSLVEAQKLGLPLNEFISRTGGGWFPRQQLGFDVPQVPQWPEGVSPPEYIKRQYARGQRPVTFDDNLSRGRDAAYDVMGQSDTLNRMSTDPDLQAALRGADNAQARIILEDWWRANGTPPRTSAAPADFWNDSPLLKEAGFDDAPPGMAFMGNGEVMATPARGPSNDLYGWMDELDDDGQHIYAAPALKDDHPLRMQAADIERQMHALENASADPAQMQALKNRLAKLQAQMPDAAKSVWRDSLYTKLADFMRAVDPQHATTGQPIFGQNFFNELSRYAIGRGRTETNASEMLKILKRNVERVSADAVTGGVNYTPEEALSVLKLTGDTAPDVLAKQLGVERLSDVSFNKKYIDDWAKAITRGQTPPELSTLAQTYDNFTKRFKALALLWPSRYSRDAYSGAFSAAMKGGFWPSDWWTGTRIDAGDYKGLLRKVKDMPRYRDLPTDEAKVREWLVDAAAEGVGTSTAADELLSGAGNANIRSLFPGGAAADTEPLLDRAKRASWKDWLYPFSLPTASGNANPILEAGDRAARFTDAGNRLGTYLNFTRKGYAPSEARRLANLTQVDYRPEAFTDFERDVMKRIFPFYSYTRGITPLIADEVVNNPAGLMGQSIRTISRGAQPSEDNFTPEYLRQSASVPLPAGLPLFGLPADSKLKRYLTNIDLPYESAINLLTPGTGNTLLDKLGTGLRKTGLNILGQSNPLIKGPLELATNRQFYSGRQLSDLYSMLEQPLGGLGLGPLGRFLEQVAVNSPGGSRILGTARQVMDDRLAPQEKWSKVLVNALTGLKFQDVDQERTKRLAARDMLNELLQATPGVRTYENITVPEDALATMPENQRRQYLLYKIIQSAASKRARDKKKAEAALDPLQVLGVIQ